MLKEIKFSSKEKPLKVSFDDVYKRFEIYLKNESQKFYRNNLYGDCTINKEDVLQNMSIELMNAFNEYDVSKGFAFTTFLYYKMKAAKSHMIIHATAKSRYNSYGEARLDAVSTTEDNNEYIVDPNTQVKSSDGYLEILDVLKGVRIKNNVEKVLIDNFISDNMLSVQEIADMCEVSRQYVNQTRKELVKRIGRAL